MTLPQRDPQRSFFDVSFLAENLFYIMGTGTVYKRTQQLHNSHAGAGPRGEGGQAFAFISSLGREPALDMDARSG